MGLTTRAGLVKLKRERPASAPCRGTPSMRLLVWLALLVALVLVSAPPSWAQSAAAIAGRKGPLGIEPKVTKLIEGEPVDGVGCQSAALSGRKRPARPTMTNAHSGCSRGASIPPATSWHNSTCTRLDGIGHTHFRREIHAPGEEQ